MELQLIRNATLRLSYAGRRLLVDPCLDAAGTWAPIELLHDPRPNPVADLPGRAEQLVADVDGVLVTHLHLDHFDARARELIPRETPMLCQPADEKQLAKDGFTARRALAEGERTTWLGIAVSAVGGAHGLGVVARLAGPVSGFVLRAEGEPTLYIAGDTVWCDPVEAALRAHRPEVVVVNAGDARTAGGHRLIMDGDDVERVLEAAPQSTVVAVHLEAVSHCVSARADLERRFGARYGARLAVPTDGEVLPGAQLAARS